MPTRRRLLASPECLALALVLALSCVLALPALSSASTYVVNTLADEYSPYGCEDETGCTLRTAISKSNENEEEDTIEFEVEGTIELDSEPLPSIYHPVVIDATTLPSYDGSPLVAIDGTGAFSEGNVEGLSFLSGAGGSRVEGLVIGGFETGIFLAGESSIYACGNYIGVGLDGVTPFPNDVGIDTGFHSPAMKIGSECWEHGGNLISGNESYGIVDFGTGTKIAQNTIGLDANGDALPNGDPFGAGILVSQFAQEPFIAGIPGEEGEPGNVIAGNNGAGVLVEDGLSHASIRRNSIYGNLLEGIEVNANPQAVPVIETTSVEGEVTHVTGSLQGDTGATYVLDFFASEVCDPSGSGEGQEYLGSAVAEADGLGHAVFDVADLAVPANGREVFTATATEALTGSTSPFSECADEPPDTSLASAPADPTDSAEATFEFAGSDPDGSVAGFECSFENSPFAPCTSPQSYSDLGDGLHIFEVLAVDQAGNADPTPVVYTWLVDTTWPWVTFEGTPSNPSNEGAASFSFSTHDGEGSGIKKTECRLDGAPLAPCSSPVSYPSLADGSHAFEVWVTDNVDHTSFDYFDWTIDTTAPTTTIETKPSNPSKSAAPSFSFSGADPAGSGIAGFECKLDGAPFATCTSPGSFSELSDGSHTYEVRAKDNAGNTDATPAVYTWVVDTIEPTTSIDTKPANPSNTAAPSFTFSGADGGGSGVAGFECKLDAGPFAACASPEALSGLADGSHTYEVRAKDNAGNTDATPETYTWMVDTVAPDTTIENKPANPSNTAAPSFTFSGTDTGGSGVAGFECKLDAEAFAACSSPKALSGLSDGSHTFEVRAKDNAGNTDATPDAYTWVVDTAVPAAPVLSETDPASPSTNTSPRVIGSAAAGTTVSLYATADCTGSPTAATPAELAAGIVVTVAADSVTEFSATATSAAALTSACSAPISYRADSSPPSTQIEASSTDSSSSATATFTFGGDDPGGSGVDHFECRLDAEAFAPCTSPKTYSGLADGPHTFEVRAVDAAGNISAAPVARSWKVDTSTPPVQPLLLPTGTDANNGESVVVAPEEGKVFVKRPGQKKATELKEGETIPVGSIVDATNGKVLLTSVNAKGEAQSAVFYGGKFLVQQHDGSGLVILKLRGGDLTSCGGEARKSGATISGKKGRKLWGSGHGNFRTEGSYGSATVRGTIWFTEDRCGGTFFKVRRGVVSVRDFVNDKTISLPAGKTYLAQP